MSLHKLTAGSGYDYLTRQVAALDGTDKGRRSLADYYSEKGEAPGVWLGSGLEGIDGITSGDIVTAEQMRALFGHGWHPLAGDRVAALSGKGGRSDSHTAQRLGTPFKVYANDIPPLPTEVARRLGDLNEDAGRPRSTAAEPTDRARIRTEVGREIFERKHGRPPRDSRELSGTIARHSQPRTTAVAGFDLTFSPVKSVSTLWAVAPPVMAQQIHAGHDAAVRDAIAFIEREALYTRRGTNGVRQVDVNGLVATAFTHRDSRAGDPDLHTHVAVANKVQASEDGAWLSVDGRILFRSAVTASEVYNTALEKHLGERLGLRFAERQNPDPRKRPVREIVGVDSRLADRWSSRRQSISARQGELSAFFQAEHGRPATPIEAIQLAQQATLETRDAKHEPRSLQEQRATWRGEALEVLGGDAGVDRMIRAVSQPRVAQAASVDARWIAQAARAVVDALQTKRATWQRHHLQAEAQRRARTADVLPQDIESVVQQLTDAAIAFSVAIVTDRDPIDEPDMLRRRDGSSVYTVAGSDVYSSAAVLAAEQRIVSAAGRTDGRVALDADVDLALMESAARGVRLNPGQAHMVRDMATSGKRVQLGIAPAGSGKTTALRALSRAWTEAGGTVVGLAPSAAAAAQLRDQTGTSADTLAKLVHSLDNDRGAFADRVDVNTLVIIDETGMADTVTLDRAIAHAVARGASVRLVGDDQQLAAIGAGGTLRDIDRTHGAVRLTELMRFSDIAEGAASLALREGRTEALGFYLDNDRIHVGDLQMLTDQTFAAWADDRANGLDAVMLAPTRDLVASLNARAQARELTHAQGPRVALSDGNCASVGDVVLTRRNDRQLAISSTDWVKNGDRWRVSAVQSGALQVAHLVSGLRVTLPPDYVRTSTELGYASTVHTAQGVTADTMHGIVSGDEVRQQLYTMLTRGRHANHVYLVTVSDGDPHNLLEPETVHPRTATDVLHNIMARDGSPRSAVSVSRDATLASTQLASAANRYQDALHVAARDVLGADHVEALQVEANRLVPGIASEPAWPVLLAHLTLRSVQGHDVFEDLRHAAHQHDLDGVHDKAAVLDWRLDRTGLRGGVTGPLPWLPEVPRLLVDSPTWGPYLNARSARVSAIAAAVRREGSQDAHPVWARQGSAPTPDLLSDVAVWRSANNVETDDRRPTGIRHSQKTAAAYQRYLDRRVAQRRLPMVDEWGAMIDAAVPHRDIFTPVLAERLDAISRSEINAAALLAVAAEESALPDEHQAAAIWWRISRRLAPTSTVQHESTEVATEVPWSDRLVDALGASRARSVSNSRAWPTLVSAVGAARKQGWSLDELLTIAARVEVDDIDLAQAISWRLSLVTDSHPDGFNDPIPEIGDLPPRDLELAIEATWDAGDAGAGRDTLSSLAEQCLDLGPLEPSDYVIGQILQRRSDAASALVSPERVLAINGLATGYFEDCYAGSWAQTHARLRFNDDLAADWRFRPGHAPAGWTSLVDHLRSCGVTDEEMLAADVALTARTGRLIDRFRDRSMLPIIRDGNVLGFVGRRNPNHDNAGPKYLNTRDTVVFHKGAQLYGIADPHMVLGAIPVLVEGPADAIAVTLASGGAFVGVATLGTSLTDEQADHLARHRLHPIIATDGDGAGKNSAKRSFWMLSARGAQPRHASQPDGEDPASVFQTRGPRELVRALQQSVDLGEAVAQMHVGDAAHPAVAARRVAAIIAVGPPSSWPEAIEAHAGTVRMGVSAFRDLVISQASAFIDDRRKFTRDQVAQTSVARPRNEATQVERSADRWAPLARRIDGGLLDSAEWPATAQIIDALDCAGRDAVEIVLSETSVSSLGPRPAKELRYRLAAHLPESETSSRLTSASNLARHAPRVSETNRTRLAPVEHRR